MTYKEQLELWVEGKSVHDGDKEGGQCCPDFSCCKPELKAPKEERELFQQLYLAEKDSEYERMLMMFLGRSIPLLTDKKVYIAGGKP
ncbi:MAG: hypothetical protein MUP16_11095 [Sedimentisphaerales bacterium]|nr:hypothetical protein [Sedimentisphaerales bacterium]